MTIPLPAGVTPIVCWGEPQHTLQALQLPAPSGKAGTCSVVVIAGAARTLGRVLGQRDVGQGPAPKPIPACCLVLGSHKHGSLPGLGASCPPLTFEVGSNPGIIP